jgi:hypothetical protein
VAVGIGLLGLLLASIIRAPHHGPRPHQVLSLDRFLLVPAVPLGAALMCITVSYGIMLAYVAMYGQQQRIAGSSFFFMVLKTAATQRHTVRASPFRVTSGGWQVRTPTLHPVGR